MSWFGSRPATHPDRRLVDRLLAGDEAAFEEFVDVNLQGIFRFALSRLGERELARDIAQSTMVQAIERIDTYRGEAPLFQWLCTVCRSQISAHFRRRSRRPEESLDTGGPADSEDGWRAAEFADAGDDPETALARLQEAAQVHTTLDELPEHYRQALTWKYHDEMTTQDIADRLGMTAKAAESLLTRARRAFRRDFAASSK
jgi:RNA polymerase sigma-70 factor (ECF subfamily)